MNPREKRAEAAKLKAQAQKIYDAKKAGDSPEFTAEELRNYDGFLDQAEALLQESEAEEARDKRINDLDARIKAGGQRGTPLPHQDPANTDRPYSLLKAIRQMASKGMEPLDGLELEVSQEIALRKKKSPQGFYMPYEFGPEKRDLTTSTGAGAKATELSNSFIEMLRNATLARSLGVRIMTGMEGDFAIPKQTAGGSAYWVTEGNAPTESNQTIGQLVFQPSTVGTFSDITRKFLLQSSIDAENFVRNDIATVIAIELDRVTFNGSGSGAEPAGLVPNADVNIIPIATDGGPITWALVLLAESTLATQNAPTGAVAWVTTPPIRAVMKQLVKFTSTASPIWDGREVEGYPAHASNQMPSNLTKGTGTDLHAAILGDWTQAIWAFWSGLDVLVDPYTGGTAGTVRIIMLQDADFQIRQPKAFAVFKDIENAIS